MTYSQQPTSEHSALPLETFHKTQPWALAFAALLFSYVVVGGGAGVLWLIDLVNRLVAGSPPSRPFITAWSVNLLFAPIALVGGMLAIGCYSAAGYAYWRKNAADLNNASIALKRLWLWARVTAMVLIAFLVCMFVAVVLTGEFPG
jgi:hypothetical protein